MGELTRVTDQAFGAIADPEPPPDPPVVVPLPPQPTGDESPTTQAAEATVEQTGADPPPEG